jgi:predicted DNA-binding antitoxin AbrB/MazE fold protein
MSEQEQQEQIDAIYDNGVLKPLVPLALPDNVRVKVTVDVLPAQAPLEPQDEWERRLLGVAKDCGVTLPDSAVSSEGLYE